MPKKAIESGEATLESRLKKLERILKRLGEGGATLEEATKLYQDGMQLVAECRKDLKGARGRVDKLNRETGKLEPLEGEE
ncbi:MAG: exodeoxyribonuclease VII small subunit [Nitrososphaerota archaeon]|nr:exodeoxyribonuclease VII small subunit [Nitrososphaerota archaeon]